MCGVGGGGGTDEAPTADHVQIDLFPEATQLRISDPTGFVVCVEMDRIHIAGRTHRGGDVGWSVVGLRASHCCRNCRPPPLRCPCFSLLVPRARCVLLCHTLNISRHPHHGSPRWSPPPPHPHLPGVEIVSWTSTTTHRAGHALLLYSRLFLLRVLRDCHLGTRYLLYLPFTAESTHRLRWIPLRQTSRRRLGMPQ